jgi:hypothetical protein
MSFLFMPTASRIKTMSVQGMIGHVCKRSGKRFKIISPDGEKELQIDAGENAAVENWYNANAIV